MNSVLIDTSVVIDLDETAVIDALPDAFAISTVTIAELSLGTHLAEGPLERSKRQIALQEVEALFEPLAFDSMAARSYGICAAAVLSIGRSHRPRAMDLMIAATAHANRLALYTRDQEDFKGLESLIKIVVI